MLKYVEVYKEDNTESECNKKPSANDQFWGSFTIRKWTFIKNCSQQCHCNKFALEDDNKGKSGKYGKYSFKEKAEIGRRTAEFGITSIAKYYDPQCQFPSTSMYTWEVHYLNELAKWRGTTNTREKQLSTVIRWVAGQSNWEVPEDAL